MKGEKGKLGVSVAWKLEGRADVIASVPSLGHTGFWWIFNSRGST